MSLPKDALEAWLRAAASWPEGYAKPRFVVPDNMYEALREAWGDGVEVIKFSDTMLPVDMPSDPTSE